MTADLGSDGYTAGLERLMRDHRSARDGEGPPVLAPERTYREAIERLAARLRGRPAPGEPIAPAPRGIVVVLGVARSGTTWLQRLLLAHPRLGGPDGAETFVFTALGTLWSAVERLDPPAGTPEQVAAVRAFCDEVLGAGLLRHSPGADRFVEKTPMHLHEISRIRRLYPSAWYVHVVRDGRDVVRSLREVDFLQDVDTRRAAALWRDMLGHVRTGLEDLPRFVEVRYEDLLEDPVHHMTGLLERLGLDVDDVVRRRLEERAGQRVSRHGTSGPVGTGKWRGLPASVLAEIYGTAGDRLVAEGYANPWSLVPWMLHPRYVLTRFRRP